MAIADDFTIDYAAKRIYHSSGTTVYSCNALYSWVMDETDELAAGMQYKPALQAPSAQQFRIINGWFIPNSAFQFLKGDNGGNKDGGSFRSVGWTRSVGSVTGIVRVLRNTSQNIVVGDIGQPITHADGDSGVLLDIEGDYLWIRPDSSAAGDNFDSTSGNLTCNGHIDPQAAAAGTGETLWSNLYSIGSNAAVANITLFLEQDGAAIDASSLSYGYATGHIDLLIRVQVLDSLIDSGDVSIHARDWGYKFNWTTVALANGGRLPGAISTEADSNNLTAVGTVATYSIVLSIGTYAVDVTGDAVDENYEGEIDLASTYTVLNAYEYLKWRTRRGMVTAVDGTEGQLFKGIDPTYQETANGSPMGTFAGGKFFGARGWHFKLAGRPASQANLYELIDSDGNGGIGEPIFVTIEVTGLDYTGSPDVDRILVAPDDGTGTVYYDQYTTSGTGNNAGSSTVTLSATPDWPTPAAGVIRVNKKRYEYSSRSGAIFTLDATAHPTGTDEANNGVGAYVPYIDQLAAGDSASVGVTDDGLSKPLTVSIRQKGIQPYETTGNISSTGYSTKAIRTTDEVVT